MGMCRVSQSVATSASSSSSSLQSRGEAGIVTFLLPKEHPRLRRPGCAGQVMTQCGAAWGLCLGASSVILALTSLCVPDAGSSGHSEQEKSL